MLHSCLNVNAEAVVVKCAVNSAIQKKIKSIRLIKYDIAYRRKRTHNNSTLDRNITHTHLLQK